MQTKVELREYILNNIHRRKGCSQDMVIVKEGDYVYDISQYFTAMYIGYMYDIRPIHTNIFTCTPNLVALCNPLGGYYTPFTDTFYPPYVYQTCPAINVSNIILERILHPNTTCNVSSSANETQVGTILRVQCPGGVDSILCYTDGNYYTILAGTMGAAVGPGLCPDYKPTSVRIVGGPLPLSMLLLPITTLFTLTICTTFVGIFRRLKYAKRCTDTGIKEGVRGDGIQKPG